MIRRVTVCIAGIMNISAYFFFSITPSSFWKSRLQLRMSFLIRIQVIFLMAAPCVQIRLFRSSYFKISPQTNTLTEQDISTVEHAHDEYSCASLCGSTRRCRYAVFDGISKKCFLVRTKAKPNSQHEQETETASVILEKVEWPFPTMRSPLKDESFSGDIRVNYCKSF